MQQHIHAIFKLKKIIKDGDMAGTYLCLSLLGVFPAQFCRVFLQTETMETQNRNEILSYILNKIDEDKACTYMSLARVTFPNTNLLGFSAMVTIEG
jgi:inosine/xanthosine triphosphate pyrophosphatase family protein